MLSRLPLWYPRLPTFTPSFLLNLLQQPLDLPPNLLLAFLLPFSIIIPQSPPPDQPIILGTWNPERLSFRQEPTHER